MTPPWEFREDEPLPDHMSLLTPSQRAELSAKRAAEYDESVDLLPPERSLLTPSQRAELRARRAR
jgi:hypothetical protein